MDVFEALKKPKTIAYKIKTCEADIYALRQSLLPKAIRYDADKAQASGGEDPMLDFVCKLREKEEQLAKLKKEYLKAYEDVEKMARVLDPDKEAVITMRYIKGEQFSEIAEQLHRSESSVFRDHRKAIAEIKRMTVNDSDGSDTM